MLDYPGAQTVVSTDSLVEGVDFNLMYFPLKHLGYKAVVAGIADIFAMNARPQQVLFSMAASGKFSLEALEEIYKGVKQACDLYKLDLAGGDMNSSLTGLHLNVTAIGSVQSGNAVYRKTAKPNDVLCVTGDLGGAYMGLQLLEREKEVFKKTPGVQPQLSGYDYILERQLKPEFPVRLLEIFEQAGIMPTSMIDISDGLGSELLHICKQSGTGAKVFEDKLPIADETRQMAKEMNMEPSIAAMNGGDDYEMLFTVTVEDFELIREQEGITPIGHMITDSNEVNLISGQGTPVPITAQGWNTADRES